MKKLLINNWVLKLFALLAAVVMWLVVVNDNDPHIPYPINNVPVEIINDQVFAENDMVYWVTEGMTVNIRVNVPQTVVKQLKASDFKLTADCTNWHPGFPTIPIEVEVVNNKSYYQYSDIILSSSFVKIHAEDLQSKMMDVEIQTIGEPAEGYTLGALTCSPEQVEVKAPESVMKLLKKVVAYVKIKDAMGDVQEVSELVLFDGNNEAIVPEEAKVTLGETEATVSAEILKTKTIPVVVTNVTGQPASGFRFTEANCSISSVTIAGTKSAISGVTGVILDAPQLNVEGAAENVYVALNVEDFLPETVRLVDLDTSVAQIELVVEQLGEKRFLIPVRNVVIQNQAEHMEYEFTADTIAVTAVGLTEDLEILGEAQLALFVDADGLEPGEQEVTVNVMLPETYELKDTIKTVLKVRDINDVQDESESETETESKTETESRTETESNDE